MFFSLLRKALCPFLLGKYVYEPSLRKGTLSSMWVSLYWVHVVWDDLPI